MLVSQGAVERIDLELHVLQDHFPTDAQPAADVGNPSLKLVPDKVSWNFLSWRFLRSAGS